MLEPFAMFRLLPFLFAMSVSANAAAQHPTPKKPCTCERELILLSEHTDVQDRNRTETAITAITYLRSLIGTEGLTERQKRTVIRSLGRAREHEMRPFKCDRAFITAACRAAGKRYCLSSISLRPAGTNQFLAEGNVLVTLTYTKR